MKDRLKPETISRLSQSGVDADQLSERQLRALEALDNPDKAHFFAKLFQYPAGFVLLYALLKLIGGHWIESLGWAALSGLLVYIGYNIQLRISAKEYSKAVAEDFSDFLEHPWLDLKALPNTDESLVRKAQALAPMLLSYVLGDSSNFLLVLQQSKKLGDDLTEFQDSISLELVVYCIHLIERITIAYLTEEQERRFMDALLKEIQEQVTRSMSMTGVAAADFREQFNDFYVARSIEYNGYKLASDEDESLKGVLAWEFGKRIVSILRMEEFEAFTTGLLAAKAATMSVESLKIDELLGATDELTS